MSQSNLSRALEHMRILIGLRYRDLAFYMQQNPAILAHWFSGRRVPSDHELENFVEFFCKEISGMNNHHRKQLLLLALKGLKTLDQVERK